jgi:DNA-binding NarL/FixJ family response regulator
VHYEDAVWATTDAPSAALGVRNTAVREALAAGWTADEIAHEVHVKPEDVHRWASAASPW